MLTKPDPSDMPMFLPRFRRLVNGISRRRRIPVPALLDRAGSSWPGVVLDLSCCTRAARRQREPSGHLCLAEDRGDTLLRSPIRTTQGVHDGDSPRTIVNLVWPPPSAPMT